MDKIIVEVGSTCTKVDKFNGKTIERIAEEISAKYIVPTDISMVYGILDKGDI